MQKVAVITDSTAYIPKDLQEKHFIHTLPQVLIWGEETFEDGVNITPTEFYNRLKNTKIMPSSSQVTIQNFQDKFKELHNQGYAILAVLISTKLSGTVGSALQAKKDFPEAQIEVFDSQSTAMALGFQVLAAARAAQDGADLQESLKVAEKARENSGVVFAVDTLEFLQRGGRIGAGAVILPGKTVGADAVVGRLAARPPPPAAEASALPASGLIHVE